MFRRLRNAWLPAAVAFAALATAALGQVVGHGIHPAPLPSVSIPTTHVSPAPLPSLTTTIPIPSPLVPIHPASLYVGAVRPGSKIPLSRLPRLPMKTMFNTIVPGKHIRGGERLHPMAATGTSITITPAAACTTGGTIGALFNVGCQLTIQGSDMAGWSTTDSYQYYVVQPNAVTATEFGTGQGCTPAGDLDPWTPTLDTPSGSAPTCTITSTLLSLQGTYAFFIYDTTKKVIATIVYVNAGQVFTIEVFQDAFHTEQAYQFDTVTSPGAYIYLTNVAPSDHYVTYVMSTGVNAYCVYVSPAANPTPLPPSPRPTGGGPLPSPNPLLCDPKNSAGVQAPGGSLSVTWSFNSELESGAYEIVVFDKDANNGVGEALGGVQVSLTTNGASILTQGVVPGATNPSPGPNGPFSTTIVARDSSADQATAGIVGTTQQIVPPATYTWSISDPQGQVISTASASVGPSNATTTNSFAFPATINVPGTYPSHNWVMQLFDTATTQVTGSQAFQIYGYHATSEFIIGGAVSSQINFDQSGPPEVVTADLKIVNDSEIIYGSEADSFGQGNTTPAIVFTTGRQDSLDASYRPPPTACTGCTFGGVTAALNNTASGEDCKSAGGCTETETDVPSGNSWTVNDYCSVSPASSLGLHDQCVITLTPVNASTVLAPGASIDIPNVLWYGTNTNGSWPCFSNPCFGTTSVLPTHGLAWSTTNNLAAPVAWTPIAWGGHDQGDTIQGTARFDYAGSVNAGVATGRNINVAQGTTPWVGAHFYNANFTRADYQNSTPFAPSTSRNDIAAITITNTSTGTSGQIGIVSGGGGEPEISVGFPSYFPASSITVDSQSTGANGWTKVACPASLGPQYVCFNGTGTNATIAGGGGTAQLFLDIPLAVPSFTQQEVSVQAFSQDELFFTLTTDGSHETTIDQGAYQSDSFDSLGIAAYSLNSSLMSASFNPPTVGSGATPTNFNIVVQNATQGSDPNPDPIDAVIIEEQGQLPAANYAVSGTPTVTTTQGGWSYLGTLASSNPVANTKDYWFGVCTSATTGWFTLAGGPPQPAGVASPLSFASGSSYTKMGTCASDTKSLLPDSTHSTATIAMSVVGPMPGSGSTTQTFYMYAHGVNDGGWSAPKQFTVTFSNESASAGFSKIGSGSGCSGLTAVATNAQPTIGTSPNCYVYSVTNTSASQTIGKVFVTLPAYDINGLPATDGTNSWTLVGGGGAVAVTTTGGTCAVNTGNTFNAVAGTSNGQIEVDCSTPLPVGKTMNIQFPATNPNVQNDTYQFPSTLETAGGQATGQTWIGDQSVEVEVSVGLTVTVDPSNPGPGGSHPVVSCTSSAGGSPCAFAGSTMDYGSIANAGWVKGFDVAKASVIYSGATAGSTWNLTLGTSSNPTCVGGSCTGGAPLSELLTQTDSTNSGSQLGNAGCTPSSTITYSNTASFVPVTASVALATGPETQCKNPSTGSAYPYEIINDFEVQVGTESAVGHIQTVTYTVVFN